MTDGIEPPIACTLDAGPLRDRLEWIGNLNTRALLASQRGDLSLTLDYTPDAIVDVREMVAREQACCAFLAFAIDERADIVRVTITAPESAREAAEALFEPFAARGASAAASKTCGCTSECGA